jgi:serine/threonine protein kinase
VKEKSPDGPEDSLRPSLPGPEMSLPSNDLTEVQDRPVSDDALRETPFLPRYHAPGDTPPLPRVGRFQCERKLVNHRGMANVYEAHDTLLPGRRAIVKIVKAESGNSLSESERDGLLHEARKTAVAFDANQEYFVLAYDLGYDSNADWAWFAMQKLSGETLREKLDARKEMVPTGTGMDVITACSWTMEILKALRILHKIGMLHGDVKPANVLVTTEGKVKLLDLGLAKFLHLFNENISLSGGTPRYLAPEIHTMDEQDHRMDLFSTGVVLYELLAGCLPEALGSTLAETRNAHQNSCIPASARQAEIPAFCKKAIAKAADPDPDRRFKTADDFLNELEAGLKAWLKLVGKKPRAPGEIVSIDGPDRWRAWVSIGLGVILFLGLGLGLWYSRRQPPPPPPPIAYQGECDVHVTQRGGLMLDDRPVLGGATESLRDDERVYITANLTNPPSAYFYVLQIDSQGQAKAIFPEGWGPGRLPLIETERPDLRLPPVGEMPMERGAHPGLATLIWFVRPVPLTREDNTLLWEACTGKEFAWVQPKKFDKVFVPFENGERTINRGFDTNPDAVVVGKDPVSQTERILLTLKDRKVAAYSRAICYPFVAAPAASANPGKDSR